MKRIAEIKSKLAKLDLELKAAERAGKLARAELIQKTMDELNHELVVLGG